MIGPASAGPDRHDQPGAQRGRALRPVAARSRTDCAPSHTSLWPAITPLESAWVEGRRPGSLEARNRQTAFHCNVPVGIRYTRYRYTKYWWCRVESSIDDRSKNAASVVRRIKGHRRSADSNGVAPSPTRAMSRAERRDNCFDGLHRVSRAVVSTTWLPVVARHTLIVPLETLELTPMSRTDDLFDASVTKRRRGTCRPPA